MAQRRRMPIDDEFEDPMPPGVDDGLLEDQETEPAMNPLVRQHMLKRMADQTLVGATPPPQAPLPRAQTSEMEPAIEDDETAAKMRMWSTILKGASKVGSGIGGVPIQSGAADALDARSKHLDSETSKKRDTVREYMKQKYKLDADATAEKTKAEARAEHERLERERKGTETKEGREFSAGESKLQREQSDKNSARHANAMQTATGQKRDDKALDDDVKQSNHLRDEYMKNPVTKTTQEVSVNYEKIQKAARAESGAGDIAMITSYMKMLDPGSTVREGEFALAAKAAGLPERIVAAAARVDKGTTLAPEHRADFLNLSKQFYEAQMARHEAVKKAYGGLATKSRVSPDVVIPDMGLGVPTQSQQETKTIGGKTFKRKPNGKWATEE